MNNLLIPLLSAIFFSFSLLSIQSLVSAEIKLTPPNWPQPPGNNSTVMGWFQNSTKSAFLILKAPTSDSSFNLPIAFMTPLIGQMFADTGLLEYADQITFGRSNYGYRYFLNLSSPLDLVKVFPALVMPSIPKDVDVPFKMMVILTEKRGDLYAIFFLSPTAIFDSKLKEIQPTLDSIQLSNSTGTP